MPPGANRHQQAAPKCLADLTRWQNAPPLTYTAPRDPSHYNGDYRGPIVVPIASVLFRSAALNPTARSGWWTSCVSRPLSVSGPFIRAGHYWRTQPAFSGTCTLAWRVVRSWMDGAAGGSNLEPRAEHTLAMFARGRAKYVEISENKGW